LKFIIKLIITSSGSCSGGRNGSQICSFTRHTQVALLAAATAASCTCMSSNLIPRPPRPALVTCSQKSGGEAWKDLSRDVCLCWRHLH